MNKPKPQILLPARPRAFFYHFNKPATAAAGKPQISVHQSGVCHIVDNVAVEVPTRGRVRQHKQPRFVMTGSGTLRIENGIAVIT